MRRAPVFMSLLMAVLWISAEASAQQAGTLYGRVTDTQSGQPIGAVQVSVSGTGLGRVTAANGTYEIPGVPSGTHTVMAQRIGYGRVSQTVPVAPGERVQLDFRLGQQALALDEIVVTGTAGEQRRRAIGNVVSTLSGEIAESAPINDMSDLLRGRVSGVVVQTGQGAPGTASVIRIRGQASMTADNQPLVYVDGVRVSNRMTTPQGGSTASAISRIDDFSPEEIESIEIIKGPAAATLYGTEAAHGVIQITTKRGAFDQPARWTFNVRQGMNWFNDPVRRTPTNYGIHPETGEVFGLNMVAHEKALGTDIFSYGQIQEYSAQVSGGGSNVRYFVSGTMLDEAGVTPDTWQERFNFRANVGANPWEDLTLDATAGFTMLEIRVPGRGTSEGAMRSVFLARPELLDTSRRGYYRAPLEAIYEFSQLFQDARRMTAGLTLNHVANAWFSHRLTAGLDFTDQKNTQFRPHLSPFAQQFWDPRTARGSRDVRQESVLLTSFDYSGSGNFDISDSWAATTSAGFQVNTKKLDLTSARGEEFPAPGVEAVGGAAVTFGSGDILENNTVGLYVQQAVAWQDRLFLTGALRADDNSAFGADFELVMYPKVSASWVVSEEPFWGLDFVSSLRLRAAFGESGQQPDVFDALRTYSPATQPDGRPAVRPSVPGNPDLGPERARELEVGFDALLWNDRVTLDLTFYDQTTRDAIVSRDVAPSSGFYERQFVNLGEVSNRGIELGLDARVVDTDAFDWDVATNIGTNRNRIEELGLDAPISLGWTTRHAEGYPVAGIFAVKMLQTELDAEGKVLSVFCDDGDGNPINCDNAPYLYAGHPDPNVEGSLRTGLTLWDRLQLDVMSDFKLGQSNYSTLGWWRYAAIGVARELWVDRMNQDPNILGVGHYGSSQEFQLWSGREASYWRLREVSLSAQLPSEWLAPVGASAARVSLSGRNLAMLWTNYFMYPEQDPEMRAPAYVLSGGDPENTAMVPPLHSLTLGLRLTF